MLLQYLPFCGKKNPFLNLRSGKEIGRTVDIKSCRSGEADLEPF